MNVPENFWPSLPYIVPGSEGLPLWWAISWWIFQVVIMGAILWLIFRWATRIDRELRIDRDAEDHPVAQGRQDVSM